jgi:flagellar basal-body rod protein FlgB
MEICVFAGISSLFESGNTIALSKSGSTEVSGLGALPMKIPVVGDTTLSAMDHYMTRLAKRQNVLASNLANIDTPGYKSKDVSFHLTMEELLSLEQAAPTGPERGGERWSFLPIQHDVFEVSGLASRADGNNVNLDKELLKLGETAFGYSMVIQLLRSKLRTIASSINEGRVG